MHPDDFDTIFNFPSLVAAYETQIAPRGGRGIDRIGISAFNQQRDQQLHIAERKCVSGAYRFAPYQEKLIARGPKRPPRQISVPTLRDRCVLQRLKIRLSQAFPECIERRLPNEFIRSIKQFAATNDLSTLSIIRTDIATFYERIRHDLILDKLNGGGLCPRTTELVKRAIRNPTVAASGLRSARRQANKIGIPQGLAISNLLASIYLKSFDREMISEARIYLRYVDDILVVVPTTELVRLHDRLQHLLAELGLNCNEAKTTVASASMRFDYLGYSLSLPRIGIRAAAVDRFLQSLAARFTRYRYSSNEKRYPKWLTIDERRKIFINEVNEKITGAISETRRYGWIFYFLELNELTALHTMDEAIKRMFLRLPDFSGISLQGLKKLSRAYFEAKYSPTSGYIHNYNAIQTIADKVEFLIGRGVVNPADSATMSTDLIEDLFTRDKIKRLTELEMDVGFLY